jgi:hypothetical protein
MHLDSIPVNDGSILLEWTYFIDKVILKCYFLIID